MARVKLDNSGNAASRLKYVVCSTQHFFFAVTENASALDIDLKSVITCLMTEQKIHKKVHQESLLSLAASLIRKLLKSSLQIKKN